MENDTEERIARSKLKRFWWLFPFAVLFVLLAVFLRGEYVSGALKDLVIPELEAASDQKVSIDTLQINLFPLFVEAKGLKVQDREGKDILSAKKVKGYVELTGLLDRRLSIRRLTVSEPEISTDSGKIDEIIRNVRTYLEKERRTSFKVKVRVIEVLKGNASLTDTGYGASVGITGLGGELILGERPRLHVQVREVVIEKGGWPKIAGDINASVALKGDRVEVKRLEIGSYGSRFEGQGFYSGGRGVVNTRLALVVDSVRRMLNLRQRGEGKISVKGEIRLEPEKKQASIQTYRMIPPTKLHAERPSVPGLRDIVVDLKGSGDFYLQTLMEVLKVKEKMEGFVEFDGELTGRLTDISGRAKARLRKGNLFNVDIDSLSCEVRYRDGVMKFVNGAGLLYGGSAQADAMIHLPVVDLFTLNVTAHSVDSKPVLQLIGWVPPVPPGKVDGDLSTSGRTFNPSGRFVYKSLDEAGRARIGYRPPANDFLNKIREINGEYVLRGDLLSLSNLQLSTSLSKISAGGSVDIARKILALKAGLVTKNVADLTLPYYKEAAGRGEFSGEISGAFDNPKISGLAVMSKATIEGYQSDRITSDFQYRKNLLEMRETVFRSDGEEHKMRGKISFPVARELFELSEPVYDLSAAVRNAEFGRFGRIFYRDFSATGRMNADFRIVGTEGAEQVAGKASINDGVIYGVAFNSFSGVMAYKNGELSVKNIRVARGKSVLTGEGTVGPGNQFSYRVSSERLLLKDFGLGRFAVPDDIALRGRSEGRGGFDNPMITLHATVVGGSLKGVNLSGGTIDAAIRQKDISLDAALFGDRVTLKGKGHFDERLPWSADLAIRPGRYDFLLSSFLKEVPEDLQLNLDGSVRMTGDRRNISAKANIGQMTLSLFGQKFTNSSAIKFSTDNRNISFQEVGIKSGAATFSLKGGMEIGREYDLQLDGSSSLSSLKALSKRIGYLKGDAAFSVSVKGKWEKPELNGNMNISDGALGLRDYPVYLSAMNGSLYMDGDRIVLKGLSGKVGGGSVDISGVVHLSAFLIKKFYVEARFADVTAQISKDFHVNLDGGLLYKGTLSDMAIAGDIRINRAKYKENLEWRSWLFASKPAEKPKSEVSALERAELNVRITGSENISIDNNIARTPIKIGGEMLVKGTISKPILFGRLETTEGYAYFRNNEFKIISASVDFVDPNRIRPILNLTAETSIQGYRIRLNLDGELDRFTLSLSSDPHLEDRDILALLTSGQTQSKLKGLEGGIGAGEATSFLTGKIQDVIEERLRGITGLDRFQVEPYVSSSTGTVGPRVTVSKRLIGERLFVTYANLVGTTEEQVIKIEYLLDRHVSLLGVRDEKGSLGGDVRFRFEFK